MQQSILFSLALVLPMALMVMGNGHHIPVPFFIVAKNDAQLCSHVPADLAAITKVPKDEACKGKHSGDQVCICKKPTPEKLKKFQDHLAAEGKKPLAVNKNGFIVKCGSCDKDLKWTPVHM